MRLSLTCDCNNYYNENNMVSVIENTCKKGLGFKGKKAAAFGSYGWSGESVKLITEELKKAGFETINDGIREMWNPDEVALDRCKDFGKSIGEIIGETNN